ncbi:MAG: pantoate--beta-alanine ligase [Alphaproteobacteria bacterium]
MDSPAPGKLAVARTVDELRRHVREWRKDGARIGLVPTMGALHEGHIALVRAARSRVERVIATIFVNPTQFGPREDFASYPRTEASDSAKLAAERTDLLFAPPVEVMYPADFATTVRVARLSEGLCGPHRPGHFEGVATIVAKLLIQALPDFAFFGEKDYQQLQVIKRLARDLDLPMEIIGVPTVRDGDGVALSSRNAYLSEEERRVMPVLYRTISAIADRLARGADVAVEVARGRAALTEAGFSRIDYLAVADAASLEPVERIEAPARVLVAAWLGSTRLIDNVAVERRRA